MEDGFSYLSKYSMLIANGVSLQSRIGGVDRKLDSENKETTECIRRNRKK